MKKTLERAYIFKTKCSDCNNELIVPYTVSDFGDAPIIRHCKYCNERYWYTLDDEAYIRPLDQQIQGIKCVRCNAILESSLVPTYKNIKCGNGCGEISLDSDFMGYNIPDNNKLATIEVYLIYS